MLAQVSLQIIDMLRWGGTYKVWSSQQKLQLGLIVTIAFQHWSHSLLLLQSNQNIAPDVCSKR